MSKINDQVTSTMQPMQKYNYCMYIPMMCANSYMLWNEMMTEYNRRDVAYKGKYRPGGFHYDTQYDYDFNYFYYLNSLFYPYYPYNPYYDYYNDTY